MADTHPSLAEVAKKALAYRVQCGIPLEAPCDVYGLISSQELALRFIDVKSLEGFYLSDGKTGQINVCACRPAGLQHFIAAHELGHHVFDHGSQFDVQLAYARCGASTTAEERVAELFAGYLLMPRRAVQMGLMNIGARTENPEPSDIFRVAAWLGVGYATLIHQMHWSLKLLSGTQFEDLVNAQPQDVKRLLAPEVGKFGRSELWPAHPSWNGIHIHAAVGDVLTGVTTCAEGILRAIDHTCHQAAAVGHCVVSLVGGGHVKLSVCKKEFVGLYEYRYLPEPEDA